MLTLSVCMATYRGQHFVAEQIDSILPQLLPGDELLVADDGSDDETLTILARYAPAVRLVATRRVGGVVPNFERVLAAADADGVVLCDQDDVWLPGRLQAIRDALGHSDLVLINGWVVDSALERRGITVFDSVGVRRGLWRNLVRNSFVGCCMAMRREVVCLAMPFPPGIPWHDWYLGLVAEAFFRVERLPQCTMLYRRHGGNHSPTGEGSRNSLARMTGMRAKTLWAVCVVAWRRAIRTHWSSDAVR